MRDDIWNRLRSLIDSGLSSPLPPDDLHWEKLAKIAALVVEASSRSFISLTPNNEGQEKIVQTLQQNLVALLETPQLLSPIERADCSKLLSQLGDPRPGVGIRANGLPDMVWCEVPAGEFVYQKDEHTSLPTFKIAKYPVTYQQFQAFLDAEDGYFTFEWLRDLPEDWVKNLHNEERYYLQHDEVLNSLSEEVRQDRIDREWQVGRQWNHPRVMVHWYDAIAFCRWLSAKLGFDVRLPTVLEWEKAARGIDGRLYPYGNQFDPTKGNTSETGIGSASAVGLFTDGASPYGVLDMSGNVFEWMLNEFDGSIPGSISSVQSPMFRGGAYSESKNSAHTMFCDGQPSEKKVVFGFRVLRPE